MHRTHAVRAMSNRTELCMDSLHDFRPDPHVVTSMQYLVWAIEDIEKTGNHKAMHHVRLALKALRQHTHRPTDIGEHSL
jgi:hypothetical protein